MNSDCPKDRACTNNVCQDPCQGMCGYEALCRVVNHSPACYCPPPSIGDPHVSCSCVAITRKLSPYLVNQTFQRQNQSTLYINQSIPLNHLIVKLTDFDVETL